MAYVTRPRASMLFAPALMRRPDDRALDGLYGCRCRLGRGILVDRYG